MEYTKIQLSSIINIILTYDQLIKWSFPLLIMDFYIFFLSRSFITYIYLFVEIIHTQKTIAPFLGTWHFQVVLQNIDSFPGQIMLVSHTSSIDLL